MQVSRGQKIIVMEKAICSLADYLQCSAGKLAGGEAKRIFVQLLGAKQELDRHNLIHVSDCYTTAAQSHLDNCDAVTYNAN